MNVKRYTFVFVLAVIAVFAVFFTEKRASGQTSNVLWTQVENLGFSPYLYDPSPSPPLRISVNPLVWQTNIKVDSTGLYIIGSFYSTSTVQWRLEKRNKNDGGLFDGRDAAHSPVFGKCLHPSTTFETFPVIDHKYACV